jgi:lauroyl/myristoyl acyltransferase
MDLRGRVPSCAVPFLGHPAPTAIGPARIALRTGAAVVVGTAAPDEARTDTSSLVVTATRIRTDDLRGSRGTPDGSGDFLALTARINDELSRRILALPHAWPWMHERWSAEGLVRERGGRDAAKCDEISWRSPKE